MTGSLTVTSSDRHRPLPGLLGLLLAFVLLGPTSLWAQGNASRGLEFRGQLRNDLGGVYAPSSDTLEFAGLELLMLNARNVNREEGALEASLDVTLPFGLYRSMYPGEDVQLTLRKLYLSFYFPSVDVSLGRQIVNFGQGRVYSPIDVFTSIDLTDLEFRRAGTDVARAKVTLPHASGLELVARLPETVRPWNSGEAAAAKLFVNVKGWDLATIAMVRYLDGRFTGGLTFKGDLEVGIYGEMVAHAARGEDPTLEAMLGLDYSIKNRFIFSAEYLWQSDPSYDDSNTVQEAANVYGSCMVRLTDLTTTSLLVLGSTADHWAMPILQFSHSLRQNVDTLAYLRLPVDPSSSEKVQLVWAGVWVVVKF